MQEAISCQWISYNFCHRHGEPRRCKWGTHWPHCLINQEGMDQVKAPKCMGLKGRDRGGEMASVVKSAWTFYRLGLREKKANQPCPLGNVAPWVLWTLINQISNSLSKRRNKEKLLQYPQGHTARPWGDAVGAPSHTHRCRAALCPEEGRGLSRKFLPLQAQTLLWIFTDMTWSFLTLCGWVRTVSQDSAFKTLPLTGT